MSTVVRPSPLGDITTAGSAQPHPDGLLAKRAWLYAASLIFPLTSSVALLGPTAGFTGQPITPAVMELNWTTGLSQRGRTADFSEAVRRLKERSGLSWQQLADAFGVSRRSLHFWANGGNLSNANVGRLQQLTVGIDAIGDDDAKRVRAALLTPGRDGRSMFDGIVTAVAAPARRTTGPDHLGLIHDTTQHHGKVLDSRPLPVKLKEF